MGVTLSFEQTPDGSEEGLALGVRTENEELLELIEEEPDRLEVIEVKVGDLFVQALRAALGERPFTDGLVQGCEHIA